MSNQNIINIDIDSNPNAFLKLNGTSDKDHIIHRYALPGIPKENIDIILDHKNNRLFVGASLIKGDDYVLE